MELIRLDSSSRFDRSAHTEIANLISYMVLTICVQILWLMLVILK